MGVSGADLLGQTLDALRFMAAFFALIVGLIVVGMFFLITLFISLF